MPVYILEPANGQDVTPVFGITAMYSDFSADAQIVLMPGSTTCSAPATEGTVGGQGSGTPGSPATVSATPNNGQAPHSITVNVVNNLPNNPNDPNLGGNSFEMVGGRRRSNARAVSFDGVANLSLNPLPGYVVCVAYANWFLPNGNLVSALVSTGVGTVDRATGYWFAKLDKKLIFGLPGIFYNARITVYDMTHAPRNTQTKAIVE